MINKKTFEKTKEGLIVRIKIIPNSSTNEIIWGGKCENTCCENEELKVKITAQPIENKANKALIEFLSKNLKVPKSSIRIIKGELSKEKTLLIHGVDEEKFKHKLDYK